LAVLNEQTELDRGRPAHTLVWTILRQNVDALANCTD
jgi:hypothetical protein